MDPGISGLIKMHLQPGVSTGWALPGSAPTCLCEPEPWETQGIKHNPAGKAGVPVLPAQEKVLNHPNPQPGTFTQPLCSKWGSALDLPINHSWAKWDLWGAVVRAVTVSEGLSLQDNLRGG